MKTMLKVLSLAALIAASAPLALATPITPGGGTASPGATTSASYMGTLVGSASGTITTPTFSANWTESVYRDASGESVIAGCATGCLDFVFSFTDVSGDALEQAALSDFSAFNIDADVADSGVAPVSVNESSSGAVNWEFTGANEVPPGSSSQTLVLYTNAVNTTPGFFTLQDKTSGFQPDLGPSAAAPEPSSLMLLGTGLMTVVGVARRKFKA